MKSDKPDKPVKSGKPAREPTPATLTRRAFIKGAGAAAAAVASLGAAVAPADAAGENAAASTDGVIERLGPGAQTFELNINGKAMQVTVEPRVTLLGALRDQLGLTGAKLVCDRGACGACTCISTARPVVSCMVLASTRAGARITTIEGLGTPDRMHPVQSAFVANDALQCGFCTPGMVMSVAAALDRNPAANLDDIKHAIAGNICRCGTYPHVFKAALRQPGSSTPCVTELPEARRRRTDLMARQVTLKLGFAGDVRDVTVVLPDDEPTAVAVGRAVQRRCARRRRASTVRSRRPAARATATTSSCPGCFTARFCAAPTRTRTVRSVDLSAARQQSGVLAALRVEDSEVRFAGQEVAAVAAVSPEIADEALGHIKVDYEPLPFVVEMDRAMAAGAPKVFGSRLERWPILASRASAMSPRGIARGRRGHDRGALHHAGADARLARNPRRVASWKGDELTVWCSTQGVFTVRDDLAVLFDLPPDKVRVITEYLGGGFGSKFGAGAEVVIAARLAQAGRRAGEADAAARGRASSPPATGRAPCSG